MISACIEKHSLESRVCAVFSSIFLLIDASIHLWAVTYKGFAWTASQISGKNSSNDYKEASSHLIKALLCLSMIPFASLVGFIYPSVFQSKKLQEYLEWQTPANVSEIIKNNQTLEKELKSKNQEIERLKLEIDSLTRTIPSSASQDSLPSLEISVLTERTHPNSSCAEDLGSSSSDSEEEFVDARENTSDLNEEIEKLKLQTDLLHKILSPIGTLCPHNQILIIQKALHKSMVDTPIIYKYLLDSVQQKITTAFQKNLRMSFLQFCTQKNPDIDSTSAIFTDLLKEHPLGWLELKDASISTFIGFV
jgi:hypothetical protein